MSSNLQKIESFLNRIINNSYIEIIDPESRLSVKFQALMEAMELVAEKIGDEKINKFFQTTLSSLVLETEEGETKDFYIYVLSEFNKENKILPN